MRRKRRHRWLTRLYYSFITFLVLAHFAFQPHGAPPPPPSCRLLDGFALMGAPAPRRLLSAVERRWQGAPSDVASLSAADAARAANAFAKFGHRSTALPSSSSSSPYAKEHSSSSTSTSASVATILPESTPDEVAQALAAMARFDRPPPPGAMRRALEHVTRRHAEYPASALAETVWALARMDAGLGSAPEWAAAEVGPLFIYS
jgi:hypothetical protein